MPPALPPLACEGLGAAGAGEPLVLHIDADSVGEGLRGRILIRVDSLVHSFVAMRGATSADAAVGIATTPAARFQGCVVYGAAETRMLIGAANLEKAWLRIGSDRPVRVRMESVYGPAIEADEVEVPPGDSGVFTWRTADGP